MRLPGNPADSALDGAPAEVAAPGSPTSESGPLRRPATAAPRSHTALRVALTLMRIGPAFMLLVLVLAMKFLSDKFLTTGNIGNVLDQSATISLLSIGMLLVILTRGIDLSVGSTVALAAVVGAMAYHHIHSGVAIILVMLLVGLAAGTVNGLVYVYGRIPHPFIVTLASVGSFVVSRCG